MTRRGLTTAAKEKDNYETRENHEKYKIGRNLLFRVFRVFRS